MEPDEAEQRGLLLGGKVTWPVAVVTFVIPFTGEEKFLSRPSAIMRDGAVNSLLDPPAAASLEEGELHIRFHHVQDNPEHVLLRFKRELVKIETFLRWAKIDIDRHNAEIEDAIPRMVADRRSILLSLRNLQSAIGYPARPNSSASGGSGNQTPELNSTIADEDYEAALQVLIHARSALERRPALTAAMDEETIRDILVVALNPHFKGNALAEALNGRGKTDILIRDRDRNVFIGECKIWGGPKTVEKALDQLLSYLVWADTNAALLLFIRNKDVTAVMDSAVACIEAHQNCLQRISRGSDNRVDFLIHANGDPEQKIRLALLPFALPSDASGRFTSNS